MNSVQEKNRHDLSVLNAASLVGQLCVLGEASF